MKLYTKNKGSNYLAKVVRLPALKKHPNADKLFISSIDFNNVITGTNAKEGDTYVYFPIECTINKNYLSWSNSFRDSTLNEDKTKKGFFEEHGRVKALKLRGAKSEGYIVPRQDLVNYLDTLINPKLSDLKLEDFEVGLEFDSIQLGEHDILLCEKYIPPNQRQSGLANQPKKDRTQRFDRMVPGQFRFHTDTAQLKKNLHILQPEDTISIEYKYHGTSNINSRVLTKKQLKWYEKLLKRIGVKIQDTEYCNLYASRSVLKNSYLYPDKKLNHWYKEDIWADAAKIIEPCLEDGITIYSEIVGYTKGGKSIQKGYDYGCKMGEFDIYVYRITSTNAQGKVIEFTKPQIQRYCQRYGLKTPEQYFYGKLESYSRPHFDHEGTSETLDSWRERLLNWLTNQFLEKDCHICKNKVPAEGIVLSIEGETFQGYKLKSFAFLSEESLALDNNDTGIEEDIVTETTGFTKDQRDNLG